MIAPEASRVKIVAGQQGWPNLNNVFFPEGDP